LWKKIKKVGIEDMAIVLPPFYLEAKDLAEARVKVNSTSTDTEELFEKYKKLKIEKISVLYKTSLIEIATKATWELIQRNNLRPDDVSLLLTATESALDQSKPLGTFVLGSLERDYNWRVNHIATCELKFTCAAGSYGLWLAYNSIISNPTTKVIVLCVDEAKYDLGSPSEPTQGAGAIAILISANPSLIALDFNNIGVFTMDTKDFYRPPGKETPITDGWYSIWCYLKCMREAFDHYCSIRVIEKQKYLEGLNYLVFHNPYGLMVRDFVSYLLIHTIRETEQWPEIVKEIGSEPVGSGVMAYEEENTRREHAQFREKFRELPVFKEFFKKKVLLSTIASQQVGNLYTASLPLQLISLYTFGNLKRFDRIGFWSFGSGAGALFFTGEVISSNKNFNLREKLENRTRLPIEEYERWRQQH